MAKCRPMTAAEKGRRIVAMQKRWYATFRKQGERAADVQLQRSMNTYFAEMDRRDRCGRR